MKPFSYPSMHKLASKPKPIFLPGRHAFHVKVQKSTVHPATCITPHTSCEYLSFSITYYQFSTGHLLTSMHASKIHVSDMFVWSMFYVSMSVDFQGSPLGRSTSPIDILGSPHSPANTVNSSLGKQTCPCPCQCHCILTNMMAITGNSAPIYPDAMTLAGQGYQTSQQQMDLANKFQRVSMVSLVHH